MDDARPAPAGGNLVNQRDARTWLDALDELRSRGAGRPPGGVWLVEAKGQYRRVAERGWLRGFLVITVGDPTALNFRGLCGLAVWVLPNHDLDSAEWSASLVPRVAACEPRALYLAPSNWGPGVDAQVVLNRGPAEPRGALPPDAPWGATWDWIDGRAGFYDRLIDYCIGEGWEIPVWVQQASARLTRWQEQEGLYGP